MLDEVSKNDVNFISDDGFQLEKELGNWVSKDFRNMLLPTSVESTASFITSIHPSKVAWRRVSEN